jgi:hypothetical protein
VWNSPLCASAEWLVCKLAAVVLQSFRRDA